MTRRRRYRVRTRRRASRGAVARIAFTAGIAFVTLAGILHINASVAGALAAFGAGFLLRGKVRVPYVRTGWRRLR